MGPATQKPKHVRQAPDWIDENIVNKLPKEKQAYWKNRMAGKDGIDKPKDLSKVIKTPQGLETGFDSEGHMYAKTRAYRRKKLPTDNQYTKKKASKR